MHIYQMSAKLLGDTMGKMNENLTSVVLAVSVFTLTLGYISKLLLKQSTDEDAVSVLRQLPLSKLQFQFTVIFFYCYLFMSLCAETSTLHTLQHPLSGTCHRFWKEPH